MFAGVADADPQAVMSKHLVVKRVDKAMLFGQRWRWLAFPGREKPRQLSGKPGPALRRATDHHRIGAGRRQRAHGVLEGADIAIDDDGNADAFFDSADGGPIGVAAIKLAARAAMNGDHADAGIFRTAGKFGRVDAGCVPARAAFSV